MSDVSFEEDRIISQIRTAAAPVSQANGIIGWLMQKGWAKTPQEANTVLITILVACVAIVGLILYTTIKEPAPSPEQVRMTEWMKSGGVGTPPPTFMPNAQ